MSTPIQTAVAGELLRSAFALQGRQNLQLEDFILPVVNLGDLGYGFAPAIGRAAAARQIIPAVAAQFGVARLVAPPGVLVELVELVATPGATGGSLVINVAGSAAAAGATTASTAEIFTDQRAQLGGPGPAQSPSGQLLFGAQAAGITGHFLLPLVAGESLIYKPTDFMIGRAPFPAASAMDFLFGTAVNEAVTLSLRWREFYLV